MKRFFFLWLIELNNWVPLFLRWKLHVRKAFSAFCGSYELNMQFPLCLRSDTSGSWSHTGTLAETSTSRSSSQKKMWVLSLWNQRKKQQQQRNTDENKQTSKKRKEIKETSWLHRYFSLSFMFSFAAACESESEKGLPRKVVVCRWKCSTRNAQSMHLKWAQCLLGRVRRNWGGLMESRLRCRCRGGPPPLHDGWLGGSAFTLTKRTCFEFSPVQTRCGIILAFW